MKNSFTPIKLQKFNWKMLIVAVLASFYLSIFLLVITKSSFPEYGADYMAWWSAGKIADTKGYSHIYDYDLLQMTQEQEFKSLGLISENSNIQIIPSTAPIFSFFVIPFQILSRISSRAGYWYWTLANLLLLIAYLSFLIWKFRPGNKEFKDNILLLCLVLFTYPVFTNTGLGQIQVFLLVCTGEFIRNAVKEQPFVAGIWLGGLLLKFQLLVLVIPALILMQNWKALKGFFISSLIILGISFCLSGYTGFLAFVDLLTGRFLPNVMSNPEVMINWRMIGVNLNTAIGSPIGWVIAGAGIVLTTLGVCLLIKRKFTFGSPEWMMIMLGVFSATIAVSWHSHYHLAMVLIPFIIYTNLAKYLSNKVMYFWVTLTPAIWFVFLVVSAILTTNKGMDIGQYQGIVIGVSGFLLNIALLGATIRFSFIKKQAIPQ